jgi:hypothetical protein
MITNEEIVILIQKMIFIYNALLQGWTIKMNENKIEFKKKLKDNNKEKDMEIYLENYLKNFINYNKNINNLLR